MARGRKPQPTTLKLLKGNPGKRPLPGGEPDALPGLPDRPPQLKGESLAEWNRIIHDLDEMNLLSRADRPAIAAYCLAWARFVDLAKRWEKDGNYVIETTKGNLIQNPLLGALNRASDELRRWLIEFGLTPAAKSRVQVSAGGTRPTANTVDRLLG